MIEERDKLGPALEQAKWTSRQLEKRLDEATATVENAKKVCKLWHTSPQNAFNMAHGISHTTQCFNAI